MKRFICLLAIVCIASISHADLGWIGIIRVETLVIENSQNKGSVCFCRIIAAGNQERTMGFFMNQSGSNQMVESIRKAMIENTPIKFHDVDVYINWINERGAEASAGKISGVALEPYSITVPPIPRIYFEDDFESGNLGSGWTTYTTGNGRVEVASGYSYGGSYSLLLDCHTNGTYSYAAAIATVNLGASSNSSLEFYWREFGDEDHSDDGVFVSTNGGSSWTKVLSFNGGPSTFKAETIDLSAYDGQSIQIKFQYYDNYQIASDGYSIDNVKITGQ